MNPYKYNISLRIRHPSICAEEIQNQLHLTVQRMWSAGEPRRTPAGKTLQGTHKETYCCFFLEDGEGKELAKLIDNHCDKLYRHKEFFQWILSSGGMLEFFIGWFAKDNCGEEFDIRLLGKLVELGTSLSIDFYPDSCDAGGP
jgi:hypothetical protein